MPDDPTRLLPWDDPRQQLRKMIAMLDGRIGRLELAQWQSVELAEASTLRAKLAALLADMESRGRPT